MTWPDMRVYFSVRGRVQGVGFRFFVSEAGRSRGLTGWVRNREDGRVEGEAQGPDERVREFLSHIEARHPWARVEGVDQERRQDQSNERGFEIKI